MRFAARIAALGAPPGFRRHWSARTGRSIRLRLAFWQRRPSWDAEAAFDAFVETHALKCEKAAECLKKDRDLSPLAVCANHHRQMHYSGVDLTSAPTPFGFDIDRTSVTIARDGHFGARRTDVSGRARRWRRGAPVVMIVPTWCGAPEEGEARLAPFLRLGTLLANTVAGVPYTTALTIFDPYLVHGQRELMETCWLPVLDSSIDAFIRAMETSVSPGCALFTHEFKGAASRVPANATAFGLRRDHVLVEILATFADGPDRLAEQRHRQWARATRDSFNAMALPGGYPNLLTGDDSGRVARSYGPNAERLIKAKRRYDPDNVFRSAIPLPVTVGRAGAHDPLVDAAE